MILSFLGRASSSQLIINGCNGSMNQSCLTGEDQEMELLMDSHTNRMLLDLAKATTETSKYDSCLPKPNQPKVPENNGIYNRGRH
ncbi:hypothetical protein ACOSQ3_007243 [Xanthoceras sorbifolium]